MHRQWTVLTCWVGALAIGCLGLPVFGPPISLADEGMFPISDVLALNLKSRGLEMDPADIFNPDQTCLIDGICRVNGCTGSFVSGQGLIITNHHCAFAAIQTASTTDHDYLNDGFLAVDQPSELPAPGYTVRITEAFEDVSSQVLSVVTPEMSFLERTKALERRQKELEKEAEAKNPGMRAEVAEMFTGERYVLFLYTFIRDVRLVFAPPASVGNFGGEVDNWEWPRHTGDFSFMRAYVAPDGSSAEYSPDNVPYQPKRFIKVAPGGVDVDDFVMLLGYPGRTVRHNTASFLKYEQFARLPFVVDLYGWQIATMEAAGQDDRSVALKLASRIKSLANVEKRSRGQLLGLKRVGFVDLRKAEEQALQDFIDSDAERRARAGTLLRDIDAVYAEMIEQAPVELNLQNLTSACQTLGIAFTIVDAAHERAKEDLERESAYTDRNFEMTRQRTALRINDLHLPTDQVMLHEMLRRLADAGAADHVVGRLQAALQGDEADRSALVQEVFGGSLMADPEFVSAALGMSVAEVSASPDPAIRLMNELYPVFLRMRDQAKERDGRLSRLYGQLISEKRDFLATGFVPDANGTLRLTYGRVEGYSPADAIYHFPITTLQGMLDKVTGVDPFIAPPRIAELHADRAFGQFAHPDLGDVPVAILYSTDTTGGNSGSPILNARGELVGVNFDRAFGATINDFAWNQEYSRSIGVDIRYVLWLTQKVYNADRLIREMGIE